MRLFITIGLGLTLTVTSACNGGGKRRTAIKRQTSDQKAASPRAKAINTMVGETKCLRIDKLVAALAQTASETMIEYTSDSNFIDKSESLTVDVVTGGQLQKAGGMSSRLNLSYDEKCQNVTLLYGENSQLNTVFGVDKDSNKDQLILTNLKDQTEKLIYEFNRNDALKITHIFSGGAVCGKGGNFKVKKTTTLAYGDGLTELKVSRTMLSMLDRGGVSTPTEVNRKLLEDMGRTRTVVGLEFPTYSELARATAEKTATKAICP